jgi:hypothetical protein
MAVYFNLCIFRLDAEKQTSLNWMAVTVRKENQLCDLRNILTVKASRVNSYTKLNRKSVISKIKYADGHWETRMNYTHYEFTDITAALEMGRYMPVYISELFCSWISCATLINIYYIRSSSFHFSDGISLFRSRLSSVCIVSGYKLDNRGSIPGRGKRLFPLTSVSRPALGLTQLPVHWVPGVLSPGVKRGRRVTLTT